MKWRRAISEHWATIRFGSVAVGSAGGSHEFSVEVYSDEAVRYNVTVELYAEPADDGATGTDLDEAGNRIERRCNRIHLFGTVPFRPTTVGLLCANHSFETRSPRPA